MVNKMFYLIGTFMVFAIVCQNHPINLTKFINATYEVDTMKQFRTNQYEISKGVRMGEGYKGDYCALQACTMYKGKLYQFFNNGYYEIRDTSSLKLEKEGKLNIPVDIHFGSVAFANKIEYGCSMPYLYATNDSGYDGNVFVIDFEKQKIIQNYNIRGGHIAGYDFKNDLGYLIGGYSNMIRIKQFELMSGKELLDMELKSQVDLETTQTAVFNNGKLYVLSGEINKSVIITEIEVTKKEVRQICHLPFYGEPEGLYFCDNGDVILTANVGNWKIDKNLDNYIHSKYYLVKKYDSI